MWCVCVCGQGGSRCAGLAARRSVALALAALPGAGRVRGRVEVCESPLVAAADLAQHLHPLAGLHTVAGLDVQRLLGVDHLKHLAGRERRSTTTGLKLGLGFGFTGGLRAGIVKDYFQTNKTKTEASFGGTFGAAVAQEVRAVVWQQEGCWLDPRAPPS